MAGDRFLVSARKYRPQTFSELASQDHVTATLRNALRLDRVAHAYLFCGPRGVGKTSAARILAKALNCETPLDERTDMDPCRTCTSCQSFEQGRSLNVIEIDAASNNGIDDIRALREAVRIPPQIGSKKVYIIDEVHMLSKAAFNGLLKTLEEPPPYIQFIFATTEPQKVLPTVLSRCQRFDFRRFSVPDIVTRLRAICEEEGIEADEASLRLIARKGDGALRDAFSTFDQAVILGGKRLVYNEIVEALGVVNLDTYFETTRLIALRDRAGLLNLVDQLAATGTDFDEFISGLTDHLRDLLIVATTGATELVEGDATTLKRCEEQSRDFSEPDLLRHLIVLNEGQQAMKRAVKPRLRLELTLLKMASLEKSADLKKILERLETMGDMGTEDPDSGTSREPKTSVKTKAGSNVRAAESLSAVPAPKAQAQAESAPRVEAESSAAAPTESSGTKPSPVSQGPTPVPVATAKAASPKASPKNSSLRSVFGAPALKAVRTKNTQPAATGIEEAPAAVDDGVIAMDRIVSGWNEYIKDVATQRIHVGALLQHTKPSAVEGRTVRVAAPDDFHERLLGREAEYLSDRLRLVLETDEQLKLQFFVSEEVAIASEQAQVDPMERVNKLRENNPIIKALFDEFGGEMVW